MIRSQYPIKDDGSQVGEKSSEPEVFFAPSLSFHTNHPFSDSKATFHTTHLNRSSLTTFSPAQDVC